MKLNDTVQVRSVDVVPEAHVSDPQVPAGPRDHWLYARVLELLPAPQATSAPAPPASIAPVRGAPGEFVAVPFDPPTEESATPPSAATDGAALTKIETIRLRVTHPGNRQHGVELLAAPHEVRTKADVLALAAMEPDPRLKRHFQAQADRLS